MTLSSALQKLCHMHACILLNGCNLMAHCNYASCGKSCGISYGTFCGISHNILFSILYGGKSFGISYNLSCGISYGTFCDLSFDMSCGISYMVN